MSYASVNVQPGGSSVPNVDANFTTDPDKARKERAKDRVHHAEDRAKTWYNTVSDRIWVTGVAVGLSPPNRKYTYIDDNAMHEQGGVLGVINVGLLGYAGYAFYNTPAYRKDYRVLGGVAAAGLALVSAEGTLADAYLSTEEGKAELRRAEQEGSALYRHTKEVVLRPGVFSGLLGAGK